MDKVKEANKRIEKIVRSLEEGIFSRSDLIDELTEIGVLLTQAEMEGEAK